MRYYEVLGEWGEDTDMWNYWDLVMEFSTTVVREDIIPVGIIAKIDIGLIFTITSALIIIIYIIYGFIICEIFVIRIIITSLVYTTTSDGMMCAGIKQTISIVCYQTSGKTDPKNNLREEKNDTNYLQ